MPESFTRPQVRDRLTAFVARWSQRRGDEKSEAQTFLNELLDCYGTGWRDDEIKGRLLALNLSIAAGETPYSPFPELKKPEPPQADRLFTAGA